ncbi:ORFL133W [Human betaherpesvirus 5]|nr:ORFL133W [Human betaherpesvirus 5]QHX40459.1 ORFL133W [Human betaherpesvirus 5]
MENLVHLHRTDATADLFTRRRLVFSLQDSVNVHELADDRR